MTTRKQLWLAVAIVATAVAFLVLRGIIGGGGDHGAGTADDDAMGGHDHAAMMAAVGDELQPVRLDDEASRRIGLTFAMVEDGPLSRRIRVVGIISPAETALAEVGPRVAGWVEELYLDYTGAPVRRGDPLLSLYSPALIAAQEELIRATRLVSDLGSSGTGQELADELLEAARRRLAYWEVDSAQISAIEESGRAQRALVLHSPANGVIIEKNVVPGSYVEPGTTLYRIADLSTIWVEGEVFEKDLGLVTVGRSVSVTLEAYPGEEFPGVVSYIHPTVSPESRTGRIRIELANPALRLKPGMYASVVFDAPIHETGLHVPRSAVLTTGTRSVVFVRTPDGTLVPREVRVGSAGREHVEILDGLVAGEFVVATANFLVDAEANLGMALDDMTDHDTMDHDTMDHDSTAGR